MTYSTEQHCVRRPGMPCLVLRTALLRTALLHTAGAARVAGWQLSEDVRRAVLRRHQRARSTGSLSWLPVA